MCEVGCGQAINSRDDGPVYLPIHECRPRLAGPEEATLEE